MGKGRLEAFSDGVIAILITIMVLDMRVPAQPTFDGLRDQLPVLLTYLLSFIFLGIYWNNHHHMLHATQRINGTVLWANLHLLFWLSLVPFATTWMDRSGFASMPLASYGVVLFMAAIAFTILQASIIRADGPASRLARAVQSDVKGRISLLCYAAAIPLAFVNRWIAGTLYVVVAMMWLIPDRRIESAIASR